MLYICRSELENTGTVRLTHEDFLVTGEATTLLDTRQASGVCISIDRKSEHIGHSDCKSRNSKAKANVPADALPRSYTGAQAAVMKYTIWWTGRC